LLLFVFLGITILVFRYVRSRRDSSKKESFLIDILITSIVSLGLVSYVFSSKGYFANYQVFKPLLLTFVMALISSFLVICLIIIPVMFIIRRIKKQF